jgi:hypothetical protein
MADVVKLGDKVKDRVTGLTGIVIARTDWLNGCIRMTVQPQELKDGKPVDRQLRHRGVGSSFDLQ